MNSFSKLRRQRGLNLEDMAKRLAVEQRTLQRCEAGDFDHISEVEDVLRYRLMALGWLDRKGPTATT